MSSFVKIKTFFTRPEIRDINQLAGVYSDVNVLEQEINSLFGTDFLDSIHGKRVLLKPNWVLHSSKEEDEICLRTHDNLLLAALKVVLEQGPKKVTIGDAPIQISKWNEIVNKNLLNKIEFLESTYNIPVSVVDFRRVTFDPKNNSLESNRRSLDEFVIFDLAEKSYLEPISKKRKSGFRVTNYNPDRLAESHRKGMHKYCITKELFKADIVISIPKIKTHEKTGITGALKNLVGVNGDKDFLPHHRVGGVGFGGDCYPGMNIFRRASEFFRDYANRNMGNKLYRPLIRMSDISWVLSRPKNVHQIAAAWYGNDTTWRMVMDLNLIANYGRMDGTLSEEKERELFSLTDGIIAGQGNGPLYPDPLPLGVIAFSNNSALSDYVMSILMKFDTDKLPLIKRAYEEFVEKENVSFILNDKKVSPAELNLHAIETIPPKGWINYL